MDFNFIFLGVLLLYIQYMLPVICTVNMLNILIITVNSCYLMDISDIRFTLDVSIGHDRDGQTFFYLQLRHKVVFKL